ncbi:hypothetical protein Droror1_Dr00025710 [Drosera rotundifolia]
MSFELEDLSVWDGFEGVKSFEVESSGVGNSTGGVALELAMVHVLGSSTEAANYMDIKGLLDLFCQSAADMIIDKTVEEVQKTFNIENDFTEEEERALRDEHKWAFE